MDELFSVGTKVILTERGKKKIEQLGLLEDYSGVRIVRMYDGYKPCVYRDKEFTGSRGLYITANMIYWEAVASIELGGE